MLQVLAVADGRPGQQGLGDREAPNIIWEPDEDSSVLGFGFRL